MISDYITFSCNPRTPVIVFIKYRMELIQIFLFFSVDFLSVMLATGKPDPVKDIKVTVTGNTTKVSWQIPQQTGTSRIYLKNSTITYVSLDVPRRVSKERTGMHTDLKESASSVMIEGLQMCSEYVVLILFNYKGKWSDENEQKFWITNNTVNADTNEDVVLAWTTGITDFFNVLTPSLKVIYDVQGSIIPNSQSTKYKYDNSSKDFQKINITIINVNETDAGLYIVKKGHVDGCVLLVVTGKPMKPTLTLSAEHPFVGDNITFSCHSTVQRWPAEYRTSHLSYQFNGNQRGATVNNMLTIHTLTMSDKGKHISCQATDDHHKVSILSDAVILDPYYGPDNVVLKPGHKALNVTEGTTLGPINCTASCNPKCLFEWKLNKKRTFEDVLSGETLVVANIKKNQAGIYRCRVVHPSNTTLLRRTDMSVNVQYSPKITSFWISDNRLRDPTNYTFNESMNPRITLRIDSNPDPRLELNSSVLTVSLLSYIKKSNNFSAQLPSLKCEDSGKFTIQARNGIAYGDNRTVNLIIWCKPRDVKTVRKIGAKVNTNVNIVMNVVALPAPNVTWIRMTSFIWTVRTGKYDYRHDISSTIQITSENGFGEHGIRICNTVGCIVEKITFSPEDRPEAPQNVSLETTFRSVNLSWIAGFNGGHRQIFSVQFKTLDDDKWDTRIVNTNDTRTGRTVYYTLDQLKPDTSYQVMVLSTNKHGKRNASLEFKTKVEPTLSSPSSASVSPLSIGIGCGIAVLLLLIILLVFISRRKKNSKTVKEDSDEPENAEYASVVKSKSKKVHYKEDAIETENNEYAAVDKSNKDYTENESVYANQEDGELLIHKPLEEQSSGRSTNQDGLTYIEVSFTSNQSDRRPIIGVESKTDYVDIDFTRKADPLPDDSD